MIKIDSSTFEEFESKSDFFAEAKMKGVLYIKIIINNNIFEIDIWNIDTLFRGLKRGISINGLNLSRISKKYIFTDIEFCESNVNILINNLHKEGYFEDCENWQPKTWS
jgi:hypothetical protein